MLAVTALIVSGTQCILCFEHSKNWEIMDVSSLYCKYSTRLSVHKLQSIHCFLRGSVGFCYIYFFSLKSPLNKKSTTLQTEVGLGFYPVTVVWFLHFLY